MAEDIVCVRPFSIGRATTFRLALLHVALFSIAVLILFGIVYWSTVRSINAQLMDEVRTELDALIAERAAEGLHGVADTIERRIDGDRGDDYLLLQSPDGGRIAGNLPELDARNGLFDILPPKDLATHRRHSEHVIRAEGRLFEDGSFLAVGRDTYPLRQLREIIVRGFLACGVATIVIALCTGMLTSRGVLRRLRAISLASGEIMSGDLSRRLAVGPRGDEFDELAGRVNLMLERIQQLVEDLQQVSNDIAHDLRTPLSRLRQRLERALTLDSGLCPVGCPADEIEKAIVEADLLLETFSAMLRIVQIDSGSRRAGFGVVDLSHLLDNLVVTYGPVAEDAHRKLLADIAPGRNVTGDAELLTQMFANLIENGIKHTAEGSTILISLAQVDRAILAVVADDGPGIAAGLRNRVCKRFVRLESSQTTSGSGLGLNLVAAIARLHEIDIKLGDNHPGLRVILRFPPSGAM